jgi:CPA2 family monovalent cation:H+ antiporter-2
MEGLPFLRDLVVLLAVGIPVVVITQRLRFPTVPGFLAAGVAIGPHGFGLIARTSSVAELAELGVMLLLFTIGLELSLSRIIQLGRVVLQGGAMQVGVTLLIGAAASGLWFGVPWNRALFYGALVALSSTAIVLKLYADRVELDSPAGRVVVSILLFQDLSVVPLMLLVPVLAHAEARGTAGIWSAVGTSLLVVVVLMVAGRPIIRYALASSASVPRSSPRASDSRSPSAPFSPASSSRSRSTVFKRFRTYVRFGTHSVASSSLR